MKYSPEFEEVWQFFLMLRKYNLIAGLGSKPKAFEQFIKLPTANQSLLKHRATEHARWKQRERARGNWQENFPHVFRYIRDMRWEEMEEPRETDLALENAGLETLQEKVEEKLNQLYDRSWADPPKPAPIVITGETIDLLVDK